MKNEDLIAALSREAAHPARLAPTATVASAAILALLVVLVLSIVWLEPRADFINELTAHNYAVVLKLVFTASVVIGALPIVRDLSSPGRRIKWSSFLSATPFAVIMGLALRELTGLPVDQWSDHIGHASWLECLWQVPALSVPAFVILALAVRRLAPTNLVCTGAYVGLLAGGIGAVGYALHCHGDGVAYVALSYTSAIFEMTLIGALLGPRVLRWA